MRCNTLHYSATQYTTVNHYQCSGQHNSLSYSFVHIIRQIGRHTGRAFAAFRAKGVEPWMHSLVGWCMGALLYRAVLRCTLPTGWKAESKKVSSSRLPESNQRPYNVYYPLQSYALPTIKLRISQRIVILRTEYFRLEIGNSKRRIFAIEFITYRYTSDRKNRSTEFSTD